MHIDISPSLSSENEAPRGSFRAPSEYEPLRIVRQIVLLQLLFLLVFLSVLWALWHAEGLKPSQGILSVLFNPSKILNLSRKEGWVNLGGILFSAAIMGVLMRPIVERSKLCLDHASTLYTLYGLFCIGEGGIGNVLNMTVLPILVMCCLITTQVSRHLCMQVELLPIPLGSADQSSAPNSFLSGGFLSTRLRACLPLITGTVARIISFFGSGMTNHGGNESVPLKTLPPTATTPA